MTAADEGGSATLAVAGPGRRDGAQGRLGLLARRRDRRRARQRLDGPGLADRHGRRAGDARGRRRSTACATGATAGALRVLGAADGLAVVNVVSLENYLRGVVASEMPSTWEPEALETQAIAARTYAVATRKPSSSAFDLYPDERSQVYRGLAAEGASSSAAIDATAGQVVLYQGQPIVTYFSSSTGGRSAAVQEALPGVDPEPYLVVGRRSLRHDLALPRLDALAERPRPLAEGRLPGPRHGPAGRRVPVRPGRHGDAERQRRARSCSRPRSCASAWGCARPGSRRRRGRPLPKPTDDRPALARRAQPRAAHGQRAARRRDAAGRGGARLARHRHARGRPTTGPSRSGARSARRRATGSSRARCRRRPCP